MTKRDPITDAATQRRNHLRRKHGMTESDFDSAFRAQDGRCARCGTQDAGKGQRYFTILRRGFQRVGGIQLVCASCAATLRGEQRSPYIRCDTGSIEKVCSHCGRQLPLSDFYRCANGKYTGECKECVQATGMEPTRRLIQQERNRRKALRRYGLTVSQYDSMLQSQDNRCAMCGTNDPGRKTDQHFCVDHDHQTGIVRPFVPQMQQGDRILEGQPWVMQAGC